MSAGTHAPMVGVRIPSSAHALARRAVEMWATRQHSTHDIAKRLGMRECDVDRIVHGRRARG